MLKYTITKEHVIKEFETSGFDTDDRYCGPLIAGVILALEHMDNVLDPTHLLSLIGERLNISENTVRTYIARTIRVNRKKIHPNGNTRWSDITYRDCILILSTSIKNKICMKCDIPATLFVHINVK